MRVIPVLYKSSAVCVLLLVHLSNINSPPQSSRDSGSFPSPTQYRKLSKQQKGKHLVWMIFKFVVFFIAINECQDSSHFFPLRQSMTVLLGKVQAVCVGMVFPGSSLCLPAMFGKPASAVGHSSTALLNLMNQDYAAGISFRTTFSPLHKLTPDQQ